MLVTFFYNKKYDGLEILKIVRNQKIDLIVMAKRRKLKGIKSLLKLGNVSRKILEHVSCPVLMIDIEKTIVKRKEIKSVNGSCQMLI